MKKIRLILTISLLMIMMPQIVLGTNLGSINELTPAKEFDSFAGGALGLVQFFGYAVSIGMILYLGIKYMMAPANEKAQVKDSSIKYVTGAILLGAATGIVSVILNFSDKLK